MPWSAPQPGQRSTGSRCWPGLASVMPDGSQGLAAVADRLCNFRLSALAEVVPPAGSRSAAGSAPVGLRLCGRRVPADVIGRVCTVPQNTGKDHDGGAAPHSSTAPRSTRRMTSASKPRCSRNRACRPRSRKSAGSWPKRFAHTACARCSSLACSSLFSCAATS